MTAASSFLHTLPAAVHPHEPARHLTTALAGAVVRTFRQGPCRALGVILSAGHVTSLAETRTHVGFSSLTERLALQGWPLLSGSLFLRVGRCLQAVSGRASMRAVFPILTTGCR